MITINDTLQILFPYFLCSLSFKEIPLISEKIISHHFHNQNPQDPYSLRLH